MANATLDRGAAPLIQKSAQRSSKGTSPTIKLLSTTRRPQVPRKSPIVPMTNQNNPQQALSINPPVIAPVPKSTNAFRIAASSRG
jgi:hypothetical protein